MFRQVANPAGERQQAPTARRRLFPKPEDLVCGQQLAGGDLTLWTDEKVGELELEKSGQGKTVSVFFAAWSVQRLRGLHRSLSLRDVRDIKRLYLSGKFTHSECSRGVTRLMATKGTR